MYVPISIILGGHQNLWGVEVGHDPKKGWEARMGALRGLWRQGAFELILFCPTRFIIQNS